MAKKKTVKKKRPILGKDFDGWTYKHKDGRLSLSAHRIRSDCMFPEYAVRVRLVEVVP